MSKFYSVIKFDALDLHHSSTFSRMLRLSHPLKISHKKIGVGQLRRFKQNRSVILDNFQNV